MGGISRTSALFTRTVTRNRLLLLCSSISPAMLPSGTLKRVGGKPSGPPKDGRLKPVSDPSPRRRMLSSTGSPDDTTVRLACTSREKPLPMAFTNVAGRPANGSGRTVRREGSPWARKSS